MIIGIDLGTTNSVAAAWLHGRPTRVPNALGEFLTPSCVSIDEDGQVRVGRAADVNELRGDLPVPPLPGNPADWSARARLAVAHRVGGN
jgi:hypothetical protein